jgi:hypothetical protein
MKIYTVKNIMKQFVCWILLLQMINISIDPPDIKQYTEKGIVHKEDLSINETESVYESVSEGIFDKDVPESDEEDIDTNSEISEFYFVSSNDNKLLGYNFPIDYSQHYQNNFSVQYPEPNSPPPKKA